MSSRAIKSDIVLVLFLLSLLMLSCYGPAAAPRDGTGDVQGDSLLPDSAPDRAEMLQDGAEDLSADPQPPDIFSDRYGPPDEDGISAPGVTFILGFVTDDPENEFMYAQAVEPNSCRETWILILDGEAVVGPESDCSICRCEEICVQGMCTMCTCMVSLGQFPSGYSIRLEWNGVAYPVVTCPPDFINPGHGCETTGTLPSGSYTARFCWGIGGPDAFPDKVIHEPICTDVPFDYPVPGGIVQYMVDRGG